MLGGEYYKQSAGLANDNVQVNDTVAGPESLQLYAFISTRRL